ncbi:MAG TPA: DUF445 domain-containing protein [Caulobacteraceae bacterium]|nr:DUF445 domain-containing protein [Caulobacteraceae bacterium]
MEALSPRPAAAPRGDPAPVVADEAEARHRLARNRALANGLLAIMALAFAASWLPGHAGFWIGLLRAGALAGIVGGLADWFAVTAIFRHPLGLPIPHTAVLPRSKERIGRALGGFVERSFLTEAELLPRLRAARPGRRLAQWLAAPKSARLVVRPVLAALPEVLRAADNTELREFLTPVLGRQLRQIDLAPLVGAGLEVLTRSGEADALFDRALESARAWLQANRRDLDRLVRERSAWWIPGIVNRQIAAQIFAGLNDLLAGLGDRGGETRRRFQDALAALIERMKHAPEAGAEMNALRDRLLGDPELQAWISTVWAQLSRALWRDLAAPRPRTRAVLEKLIASFGRALAGDAAMQARIDAAVERLTRRLLGFRGEISGFIAEVIGGWDAETIAARLELVIGSDLQYIRMNGTLVGALVGCAIYLVTVR